MTTTKPPAEERLLVCNCQRTMEIDGGKLGRSLGGETPLPVHTELCRSQLASFEKAVAAGGSVHVACTQEAPLLREVAAENGSEAELRFTNIRETAGWCEHKGAALPKMAALLAEAAYRAEPTTLLTLKSEGTCLVYGAGQRALDVAHDLAARMSVTLLLTDPADAIPPRTVAMPVAKGRIRTARGHIGAFEIEVDGYAPVLPSSRASFDFAMARDGAKSRCDLILDLSGRTRLFSDKRRDGYLHADPQNPAAVARAMFDISDLVGEFEKPRYVHYDAGICAHARSHKVGCTNCLEVCPTGAITPDGEHVAIDPAICGGCGNCAAVCPTGAASYAYPRREDVIGRVDTLLSAYRAAGGARPILLAHDEKHGGELISAMARFGRGLPPNVLPLSFYSVLQLGHDLFAAMLALGAEQIVVLAPPEEPAELASLWTQAALAGAFLSGLGYEGARVAVLVEHDPDAVEAALFGLPTLPEMRPQRFTARGTKRDLARTALGKLRESAPVPADIIALPRGAPYGRIRIRTEGCTLCLACVGACPTHALGDNPDRPELSFTEAACVQCGICVATCPESVISLEPRYDFTPAALTPIVLKGEEPFHCTRCGKPFGTRASVEKVMERLKGHSMFRGAGQLDLIGMCDDCRVVTMAESTQDPMRLGPRPRIRTTDDYLVAAADAKSRKPDDVLG
jgi:ferredoxin